MQKKGNDFATEVDLAIERQVVEALVSRTGIEVHGEEFGGADIDSPLVWVLDPIDGTFNYAAGLPTAAILLGAGARRRAGRRPDMVAVHRSAIHRCCRKAVVRQRCCAATACNRPSWPTVVVGTSTFDIDSAGAFPAAIGSRSSNG